MRDQSGNQMARVNAVKALEQIDGEQAATRGNQSIPGLVIVINPGVQPVAAEQPPAITTTYDDNSGHGP